MEITVYFDSSLESFQVIKPKYNLECAPATVASSINANYYAFSVNGESMKMNPNYHKG